MNTIALVRETTGKAIVVCPGCRTDHTIDLGLYEWDGGVTRPSFWPELNNPGCRAEIRDGFWRYAATCAHDLAGQTVPVPAASASASGSAGAL